MRLITFAALGFLTFAPANHALDAKSDFVTAYKAYEKAVENQDLKLAREMSEKAYTLGKEVYGADHITTAILALNYSRQLFHNEKKPEIVEHALSIFEREYGENSEDLIDMLIELGDATMDSDKTSTSLKHYKRAMAIAEEHYGKNSILYADISLAAGRSLLTYASSYKANNYMDDAISILEGIDNINAKVKLAEAYFWYGKYKLAKHHNKAASENLSSSLNILEPLAPNAPLVMTTHAFLIEAYERQGRRDEATKHCLAIGKAKPIKNDQDYMPVYRTSPAYPVLARQANREGYAIISLTVDKSGFVKNPMVVESDGGNSFEKAAIKAAEEFRYIPRFENGEPVESEDVRYKFTFELSN